MLILFKFLFTLIIVSFIVVLSIEMLHGWIIAVLIILYYAIEFNSKDNNYERKRRR